MPHPIGGFIGWFSCETAIGVRCVDVWAIFRCTTLNPKASSEAIRSRTSYHFARAATKESILVVVGRAKVVNMAGIFESRHGNADLTH